MNPFKLLDRLVARKVAAALAAVAERQTNLELALSREGSARALADVALSTRLNAVDRRINDVRCGTRCVRRG